MITGQGHAKQNGRKNEISTVLNAGPKKIKFKKGDFLCQSTD